RSATFTITSNGTGSPQTVTLTGKGLQGTLTLTPDPLNFPDTVVGRQSPAVQTVTVANNSNVPVTISGINTLAGSNPTHFLGAELPNSCGRNSCIVSPGGPRPLRFSPKRKSSDPRSATFTITSNGVGSPQMVTLTGNGLAVTKTLT